MQKKIERIISEINACGGSLFIHEGSAPLIHSLGSSGDTASLWNDHKEAHIYLNGDTSEESLLHELLHLKISWVLQEPTLQAMSHQTNSIKQFYGYLINEIEHVWIFKEQKNLGFKVPEHYLSAYRELMSILEDLNVISNPDGLREVMSRCAIMYLLLENEFILDNGLLSRLKLFFKKLPCLSEIPHIAKELWMESNSIKGMIYVFQSYGIIDENQACLLFKDVKNRQIRVEHISNGLIQILG